MNCKGFTKVTATAGLVFALAALVGCGPTRPVASAGDAKTVSVGDTVVLDASQSTDVSKWPLTYVWALSSAPAGSKAVLDEYNRVNASFVADKAGTYTATLIVSNKETSSDPVTVTITATASAPVARPMDAYGTIGQWVVLDGTRSTATLNTYTQLVYKWTVTDPKGGAVTLINSWSSRPSFLAEQVGNYAISLVVNDGSDSAPGTSTAIIAYYLQRPVAIAPAYTGTQTGDTVTIDGSLSYTRNYLNGEPRPLTYTWSMFYKPSGSTATITGAAVATFVPDKPGYYYIKLVVDDGLYPSEPIIVYVYISESNRDPTANAGPNLTVNKGQLATLNGAASYDPEAAALTYAWTLASAPAGSTAVLGTPTAVTATLTCDRLGAYLIRLVVTDDKGAASSPSNVTVNCVNGAPTAVLTGAATGFVDTDIPLDASTSSDPDGDPLLFAWSVYSDPPGAVAGFTNPTLDGRANFKANKPGVYVLRLDVTDVVGNYTVITKTVTLARAGTLTVSAGGSQAGPPNLLLADGLVVQAMSGTTPVPNAKLKWTIAGGRFAGFQDRTGTDGKATAFVLAGRIAQAGKVTVALFDEPTVSTSFDYTIAPGPTNSLAVQNFPGDVINGALVRVRTVDKFGNFTNETATGTAAFRLTVNSVLSTGIIFDTTAAKGTLTSGGGTNQVVGALVAGEFEILAKGDKLDGYNVTLDYSTPQPALPIGLSSWKAAHFTGGYGAELGLAGWVAPSSGSAFKSVRGISASGLRSFVLKRSSSEVLASGYSALISAVPVGSAGFTMHRLEFKHQLTTSSALDPRVGPGCSARPSAYVAMKAGTGFGSATFGGGVHPIDGYGVNDSCDGQQGFTSTSGAGYTAVAADVTDAVEAGYPNLTLAVENTANPFTPLAPVDWSIDDVEIWSLADPSSSAVTTPNYQLMWFGPAVKIDITQTNVAYQQCLATRAPITVSARAVDAKNNRVLSESDLVLRFAVSGGNGSLLTYPVGQLFGVAGTREVDLKFAAGAAWARFTSTANETDTFTPTEVTSFGFPLTPATVPLVFANYICHSTGTGQNWSDTVPLNTWSQAQALRACDADQGTSEGACSANANDAYPIASMGGCTTHPRFTYTARTNSQGNCAVPTFAMTQGSAYNALYLGATSCGCVTQLAPGPTTPFIVQPSAVPVAVGSWN